MKKLLFYLLIALLATFAGGVWYFSEHAEVDSLGDGAWRGGDREGPALFDGFIDRWNGETARDRIKYRETLTNEIERLEQAAETADPLKVGLLNSKIASLRARRDEWARMVADGPAIMELPLDRLPAGLDWQDGMDEPEIGDPAAVKGGWVNLWNPSAFPSTLRPFGPNSRNYFNYSLYDNVAMRLVGIHPATGGVIPGLARKWAVGSDGRTVFFEIHPDAAYSDGRPVRARDFLLNICVRASEYAHDPYYVDLFRKQYSAVRTYGNRIIAVTLPRAKPFLPYMAAKDFYPAHPGFYADFNPAYVNRYQWRVPPATGGYTVLPGNDVVRGRSITMRRVRNWWARDMKFYRYSCNVDSITHHFISDEDKAYELFRRGDIDALSIHKPENWNEKLEMEPFFNGYIRKVSLMTEYPRAPYGLFVNCAVKPLDDLDVRLGLQHAINMDIVLERVFQGDFDRLGSYASGYGDLTNPAIKARPYSPERAREYFAKAGYDRQGSDGILRNERGDRLQIELSFVSDSDLIFRICSLLRQYALACGVDLKLDMQESSVCSRKVFEKRHQVAFWAWPLPYPLPELATTFHSSLVYDDAGRLIPNTDNIVSIADVTLDRLLAEERSAPTHERFKTATHAIQQRLHDLAVWVPGWEDAWARIAFWRWMKWPGTINSPFCPPAIYDPLESHLYWIDPAEREATLKAKRDGIAFPECDIVINPEVSPHK